MPSSIEQFIYGSLFSFILCGFMALGFFLMHDKILKDKLEINHDLHDIFENFPISQTITVVIDGEGTFFNIRFKFNSIFVSCESFER
jgi:hypothetical protein